MKGAGGIRICLCLTEGSLNKFPGSGLKSRLKLGIGAPSFGSVFLGVQENEPGFGAAPHGNKSITHFETMRF